MLRYAGTIERMRYTIEVIRQYLAGELDCIEELEPEIIQMKKQRFLKARAFMLTSYW